MAKSPDPPQSQKPDPSSKDPELALKMEMMAQVLIPGAEESGLLPGGLIAQQSLRTIKGTSESAELNRALQGRIDAIAAKVRAGDLSDLETMLVNQAYLLHSTFESLMVKGSKVQDIQNSVRIMDCAMKAQKQSKQIVQTLNEMKNPKRTQIVDKQFNQMVVTGDAQMDSGSAKIAGSENPAMETLGAEQRPNIEGGQGDFEPEFIQTRDV